MIKTLKNQDWWKKQTIHNGTVLMCQHISNLQIGTKDYYCESANPGMRRAVSNVNQDAVVFDIATKPTHSENDFDEEMIKKSFIVIIKEKIQNDLETYRCLIEKMDTDGKLSKEKAKLNLDDVIACILKQYAVVINKSKETFEDIEKKNKKIEEIMREALKKTYEV